MSKGSWRFESIKFALYLMLPVMSMWYVNRLTVKQKPVELEPRLRPPSEAEKQDRRLSFAVAKKTKDDQYSNEFEKLILQRQLESDRLKAQQKEWK